VKVPAGALFGVETNGRLLLWKLGGARLRMVQTGRSSGSERRCWRD